MILKNSDRKIELLAPAGSEETFFAAVDAGADSVYLGLQSLNARIRAKNFSLGDLETLIPYAHDKGVKIYITLNTMVKQEELPGLLGILLKLESLGPDAVIVQDLGVAMLAMLHAPSVPIHASTQMTVHNSVGASQLKKLGFSRVILARECTLEEISAIVRHSGVEIEIFGHGALCYSYSGQCYFSSYLGGSSANRGHCTQPCRRSYKTAKGDGAWFSPKDLCLIDRLSDLVGAGVTGIKIEGRLKSAEYVTAVVGSYRQAIDCLPKPPKNELVESAMEDFGRAKSTGHLVPDPASPLVVPGHTAGSGKFLGKVLKASGHELVFSSKIDINIDDRLRVTKKFEGEREAFVVKKIQCETVGQSSENDNKICSVPYTGTAVSGDLVFLVGRKSRTPGRSLKSLESDFHRDPKNPKKKGKPIQQILGDISRELQTAASMVRMPPRRMIRAALPPGARDIIRLLDRRVDDYIITMKHREIYSLPRTLRNKVVLRVPVFIRERDLRLTERRIRDVIGKGFTRFLIGNIAHFALFDNYPEARLQADYTFGMLNSATLLALAKLGAEMVAISIENDIPNFEALTTAAKGFPLELVAYGRPPLFTSAVPTSLSSKRGAAEVKDRDDQFFVEKQEWLTIVVPKTPFALMGPLKKHQIDKVRALRLELSSGELQTNEYNRLRSAVEKWTPLKAAKPFNYRVNGGLK